MTPALTPALQQLLQRQLLAGEHVRWAASPSPRRLWDGLAIWLFAIPWTAFSLFWEGAALSPWFVKTQATGPIWTAGIVFPLFGLPFVLIGFALLYAPFHRMRKAGHTVHALTNLRLLTVSGGRTTEAKSVWTDRIGPVTRREGRDGWGSIKVETHSRYDSDGDVQTSTFEMAGLPDVARVERMILQRRAA